MTHTHRKKRKKKNTFPLKHPRARLMGLRTLKNKTHTHAQPSVRSHNSQVNGRRHGVKPQSAISATPRCHTSSFFFVRQSSASEPRVWGQGVRGWRLHATARRDEFCSGVVGFSFQSLKEVHLSVQQRWPGRRWWWWRRWRCPTLGRSVSSSCSSSDTPAAL